MPSLTQTSTRHNKSRSVFLDPTAGVRGKREYVCAETVEVGGGVGVEDGARGWGAGGGGGGGVSRWERVGECGEEDGCDFRSALIRHAEMLTVSSHPHSHLQ